MITGNEIRLLRRSRGYSQTDIGKLLGLSRHTISYWERKPHVRIRTSRSTPARILSALGLPQKYRSNARARAWGLSNSDAERLARQVTSAKERQEAQATEVLVRNRVVCGATTRKGRPCRLKSEPNKRRCKFHGGKSTGPKTPEGRARISQAQKRRWAAKRSDIV